MKLFSKDEIGKLEQRFRTNLINSLSGLKPVALIGSANQDGQANLTIFNSLIHIGANPPLLGLIFRPDTVERHTLRNILQTGCYTINLATKNIASKAHQTSARYPANVSEFEATGLTALWDDFSAPFVKECPIRMGMQLREKIDIHLNGTHLVIGEIHSISIEDKLLEQDGHLRPEKADIICCNGLDTYYTAQWLDRFPYAKP
jgi:flavin reductase (DIM6/NTAB) family NADH-FMN oxidoreductase RutF